MKRFRYGETVTAARFVSKHEDRLEFRKIRSMGSHFNWYWANKDESLMVVSIPGLCIVIKEFLGRDGRYVKIASQYDGKIYNVPAQMVWRFND